MFKQCILLLLLVLSMFCSVQAHEYGSGATYYYTPPDISDTYSWSLMPLLGFHFDASEYNRRYIPGKTETIPTSGINMLLADIHVGGSANSLPDYGGATSVGSREELQALMRRANSPEDFATWEAKSMERQGDCIIFRFVSIGPKIPVPGTDNNQAGLLTQVEFVTTFVITPVDAKVTKETMYYLTNLYQPWYLAQAVF